MVSSTTSREERLRWHPDQALSRVRESGGSERATAALALCEQLAAAGVPLAALEMAIVVWSRALDGLDPGPVPADRMARLERDLSLETSPVVAGWMDALRRGVAVAHDLDAAIRFLMQARGIWLATARMRAQAAPSAGDEFPIGASLDNGSCLMVEWIRGNLTRGMLRAVDPVGRHLLVTVTSRQELPLDEIERRLGFRFEGVAALRHVGPLGDDSAALVEEEPAGRASSELALPLPPARAVELAAEVAAALERVHADRRVLRFLRPELIYVEERDGAPHLAGIAPRAELFAIGASPVYGAQPLFDQLFAAPEVLAGHKTVSPAADVFSLCAVLALWLTGEHPFAGGGVTAQMGAIVAGKGRPWRGPTALGMALSLGLERTPAARPSLQALIRDLRAAADQP
ncbi:MAG TPA: hypothetical protein VFU21_24925 [Kofleriaceae bacterium]|nr:hypothetical protein [Kofleriaceae bacterium]